MVAKGPPKLVPSAHCLAIAQRNQQQSPLLRLPAELRTRIYENILDTKTDKILHDDFHEWDRLNFSRTCRQTFAETAKDYFDSKMLPLSTEKGVSCCEAADWEQVLYKLTPSQGGYVTTLVLDWWQVSDMVDEGDWSLSRIMPRLPVLGILLPKRKLLGFIDLEDMAEEVQPYTNTRVQMLKELHEPLVLSGAWKSAE